MLNSNVISLVPRILLPADVAFGRGSLVRLKGIACKRCAIIHGSSWTNTELLARTREYFTKNNAEVVCIPNAAPRPTFQDVIPLGSRLAEFGPDVICSIGGGSTIDSAKLAWALYEHPALTFESIQKFNSIPPLRSKARFVAAPTTVGSGSEASIVSVLSDPKEKRKVPIVSTEFLPDLVILDPEVLQTLSEELVLFTAMDALAHSVESYVSLRQNHVTSRFAAGAARMIFDHLNACLENPHDIRRSEYLQHAAFLAGVAQSNTSVGITHSIAHQVEAHSAIPHGLANALFLVPVILFNAETTDRYDALARETGFGSAAEWRDAIGRFVARCKKHELTGRLLKDLTVESAERVAQGAFADVCTRTNPRRVRQEDLQIIITSTIEAMHREG